MRRGTGRGVGSVCRADGGPRGDRRAVAGTGGAHARMVRAAPRAHLRLGARASRRSHSTRAAGPAVRDARSVSRGAGARSSGGDRRSIRHAVPRRGLSDPFDSPLGERTGMGRGVHPERRGRKFSVRVLDGPVGSNRGRAAPAVCRDDAREERPAPDRAAEILRGQPAEERRPSCLRRAQPIPDEGRDGHARRDHVARRRRSARRARVEPQPASTWRESFASMW